LKLQIFIISSFIATLLVVIVLFTYYMSVMAETNIHLSQRNSLNDIYDFIKTRINWTARGLCEALLEKFGFSYVNVSITTYDILKNNTIVYRDSAVYKPIDKQPVIKSTFIITDLCRDGKYVEYVIEVGWD